MKRGFTLIETLIALGIATIIMFAATNLMLYANEVSGKIALRNELFANAQITLDFIIKQMQLSVAYNLLTDGETNSLMELVCYKSIPTRSTDDQAFVFNANLPESNIRYGQVGFGGIDDHGRIITNTLSSYIDDVIITVDNGLMTIRVITKETTSSNSVFAVEPIELSATISVQYKQILER